MIKLSSNTVIFQRYIDDLLYITKNETDSKMVKNLLKNKFDEHRLQLTFREINTQMNGAELEFLNVLHVINHQSPGGFITKDFTKPTAAGHTFVNGRSHHPPHVFRGIVLGEGQRLRRLNETEEGFKTSIQRLQEKCLKSNFNETMVTKTIQGIKAWKQQDGYGTNRNKANSDRLTWATQFKNILRLGKKEKRLAPKAAITYCRPATIGHSITNYKMIATERKTSQLTGSHPCGKCGLCGNFGRLKNMVLDTEYIKPKNGKEIKIRDAITCKDNGIYAARCTQCSAFYVGQTITSFSTRWNTHRLNWRKMVNNLAAGNATEEKTERWRENNALYLHYAKTHLAKLSATMPLSEAYQLIFVEKPRPSQLDMRENYWIGKVDATINIAKTYMPKYK